MMTKHTAITLAMLAAASFTPASADVIDWGFELAQTPTSSFDSTGTAVDSSYTFYLGTFADSFAPTVDRSNFNDWLVNWSTLDSATFDDGVNNWFNGSVNLTDNTIFETTDPVYIWGTNGLLGDAGENILLTSANWAFPSASPDPDLTEFFLSDVGLTAVVGAVNSSYDGDESGISNTTFGAFDIQTEAVPEPRGAVLLGIGLTCLLFRRRRTDRYRA